MKTVFHNMLELLSPERCAGCDATVSREKDLLCGDCFSRIETVSDSCPRCSGPLAPDGGRCMLCDDRAFYLRENVAVAEYRGVMKRIMGHYKFRGARRLHRRLFGLVKSRVRDGFFTGDYITAVPLDSKSLWRRGYNQSELIARAAGSLYGIPYLTVLKRKGRHRGQKYLGSRERCFNVLDAFRVVNGVRITGKKIILVDDVFTTGATINECARTLVEAGAAEVSSLTIARADESYENLFQSAPAFSADSDSF